MIPVPVLTDASQAFGNVDHLPDYKSIPDEFKNWNGRSKWNTIVTNWFFKGLPKETEFIPKPGVDGKEALRALNAIMRSWAPKHEHKEAGVAYLMSEWFEDVKMPTECTAGDNDVRR